MIGITMMPNSLKDLVLSDKDNVVELMKDPKSGIHAVYVNKHLVLKAAENEFSNEFYDQDFGKEFSSAAELIEILQSYLGEKELSFTSEEGELSFED